MGCLAIMEGLEIKPGSTLPIFTNPKTRLVQYLEIHRQILSHVCATRLLSYQKAPVCFLEAEHRLIELCQNAYSIEMQDGRGLKTFPCLCTDIARSQSGLIQETQAY